MKLKILPDEKILIEPTYKFMHVSIYRLCLYDKQCIGAVLVATFSTEKYEEYGLGFASFHKGTPPLVRGGGVKEGLIFFLSLQFFFHTCTVFAAVVQYVL